MSKADNSSTHLMAALSQVFGNDLSISSMCGFFNRMKNTFMITDSERKICWVNASFELSTGYTLEEIKGRHPHDFLFDPTGIDEPDADFSVQLQQINKDGSRGWTRVEVNPVLDAEGNIIGFTATGTDVTASVRQLQLLAQQNTALKEVAFTSSHLIRAPLTNIMSLITLLEEEPDNKQLVDYLSESATKLDEAVQQLTRRISEVYAEKS